MINNPSKNTANTRKKNICSQILRYLSERKDHTDDLDGITLVVYNKELENLSDEILDAIMDLLSKGLIIESKNYSRQKYYQLTNNQSLVSEFLRRKHKKQN